MSYGPDIDSTYRQLVTYVDKFYMGHPRGNCQSRSRLLLNWS